MDPLKQMRLMTTISKLETATENKARALGIDAEKYQEHSLDPILNRVQAELPKDLPQQLEMFRKAVGEDMWATIAQNPSLPVLVAQHMDGVKTDVLRSVKAELVAELDGYIAEETLDELFQLQFGL